MAIGGYNFIPKTFSTTGCASFRTKLPSDDTFSLVPVSKAVTKQTCQLSGSKGWSCRMTTTHVQPPPLGSATVYLEWGGSEIRLGSITGSGMINNIPRDTDIKIIVSGGFHPITESIHTPLSQTNYAYTCTVGGCNFTPKSSSNTASTTLTQTLPSDDTFSLVPVSKAVTKQTCQLSGSKGWSCRMTTTHVQPPPLGSATVYLEWGGSEIRLGSITGSGMINNIPRDTDIKIIVSGGFHPITESIHTPLSQINYVYVCTIDGCNFTPSAPQNLKATAGIGNVTLSWQVPSSNGGSPITGYKIYRSSSSGTEGYLTTLGSVTSYTDTGLARGHTYFYKVSAVNSVGTSHVSNEISATTLTIPSAPQNLQANGGIGNATLSWSGPANNDGS